MGKFFMFAGKKVSKAKFDALPKEFKEMIKANKEMFGGKGLKFAKE